MLRSTLTFLANQYTACSYQLVRITSKSRPKNKFLQKQLKLKRQQLIERSPYYGRVISARTDGLLARINCLFNGLIIAEHHGAPFSFTWVTDSGVNDNAHCCVNGDLPTFISSDFIARYYIPEHEAKRQKHRWQTKASNNIIPGGFINAIGDKASFRQKIKDHGNLIPNPLLNKESYRNELTSYSDISKRFFSDSTQQQFDQLSKKRDWGNTIAIHYRGGDVIHGNSRMNRSVFDRALALPLVERIIKDNAETPIIIFGSPALETLTELCYLKRKYPHIELAIDIMKNDKTSRDSNTTIHDAYLMSLCKTLHCGGRSSMTTFAKELGNVSVVIPSESLQRSTLKSSIESDTFMQYADKQKSFIYYNLFHLHISMATSRHEELDSYLTKILEFDPEHSPATLLRYLLAKKFNLEDLSRNLGIQVHSPAYNLKTNTKRLPLSLLKHLN